MLYKILRLNPMETLFYDSEIKEEFSEETKVFENEACSVQFAFRADFEEGEANGWDDAVEIDVEVSSVEGGENFTLYSIENVPCHRIGLTTSDDWFLRKGPGLYPDRLQKITNKISVPVGYWRGIWINFNEEQAPLAPGKYGISIKLHNNKKEVLAAKREVFVEVVKGKLPRQRVKTTNWVHYDCIAHFSKTRPFSKAFYSAARQYIKAAAKNGQNMILLPAFTPPLDTPVGEERPTAQLVDVKKRGEEYIFNFSKMKEFIDICLECGIEYFEHCHLYTQWGAEHAPKIKVNYKGKSETLFGWQTDASLEEYRHFLHRYITELKKFMKENDLEKRFFFHISDEPNENHLRSYKSASDFLQKELEGFPIGDALSEYKFYEAGMVQTPIPTTAAAGEFIGRANPLWIYFTGYESFEYLPNRLIGMPKERGRILGVQLYYYDLEGFLNWGFNAHHNRLSRKFINPSASADMGGDFCSGTSYMVYPEGGDMSPSIRLITFRDAMTDYRALDLLQQLEGRDAVLEIIKKHIPNISLKCRVEEGVLEALRKEINERISKNIK